MKKGFTKVLVALCLAVPCLTGCGFGKQTNNNNNVSSSSNNNNNNGANNNGDSSTSPFGGISDITQDIDIGNIEIGKINNTPVSKYQEATEKRIEETAVLLFGSYSTYYDENGQNLRAKEMKEYMIDLGVGDELAIKFCDFVDGMYEVSYVAASTFNKELLGQNSKKVQELYDDALVILNSMDFTRAATLLEHVNSDYKADAQEQLNKTSLASYVSPYLLDISYPEYQKLMSNKSKFNNQTLNSALDGYTQLLNNYAYKDYQRENYNDYLEELRNKAQNGLIPSYYISFVRKHANEAKDVLLKDIKIILDAYYTVYSDVLDYVEEFSSFGSFNVSTDVLSVYYSADHSDVVKMIKEIINKTDIIALCEAVAANEKLGDLLIDAALEIMVPALKDRHADDAEKLALVNKLETRLKGLSGKQIKSVVSFALKFAKKVDLNEVAELLARYFSYSYAEQQDKSLSEYIIELGDKYINDLDSVIASATADEKNAVLSVSSIFGLDILEELKSFSRIYHAKDLSTEEGWSSLGEALSEWANAMGEKLYDELGCLFEGGKRKGYHDEPYPESSEQAEGEGYRLYCYGLSEEIYAGKQMTKNSVLFDYFEYDSDTGYSIIDFYGHYDELLSRVEEAKQELNNYIENVGDEIDQDYYNQLSRLASLTVDVSVSIDTSKVAMDVPYTVTVTVNGHTVTRSGTANVLPQNFVRLHRMYGYVADKDYSQYTVEERLLENYSVAFKGHNQQVYFNKNGNYEPITLDTRETGWHLYTSDASEKQLDYYSYYVVDEATLNSHMRCCYKSIGVYLEGDSSWSSPSIEYRYEYDDYSFYVYKNLYFDSSYVQNKAAGKKYSVTVDGLEFEYAIVSANDPVYTSYTFTAAETIGEISTPTTKTVNVEARYEYRLVLDNVICYADRYVNLENQTLTNFTCVNGVVKFNYNGTAYSFVYNYSSTH